MKKMLRVLIKTIRASLAVVVVVGTTLVVCRINNYITVNKVLTFQKTLTEQRSLDREIEQTAITDRILDINEEITVGKILANIPVIKYFYVQEFRDLELIK